MVKYWFYLGLFFFVFNACICLVMMFIRGGSDLAGRGMEEAFGMLYLIVSVLLLISLLIFYYLELKPGVIASTMVASFPFIMSGFEQIGKFARWFLGLWS